MYQMTKLRYRTPMRPVQGPLATEWQSSGSNPSVRPPNLVLLPKSQNWPAQADQAWLLNLYTALGSGQEAMRTGWAGRGWAGSSARQRGPGQDGKSGGLRSVESGEVIEGHSRGWVQAGQGSSETISCSQVWPCPASTATPPLATSPGATKEPPGAVAGGGVGVGGS